MEQTQEEYNERRMKDLKAGVHTPEHGPKIKLAAMTDIHLRNALKTAHRQQNLSDFWKQSIPYFKKEQKVRVS